MSEFVVMTADRAWGKGKTVKAAKAQARREGGTLSRYVVLAMPEGALNPYVDQMGTVRWDWDPEAPDTTAVTTVVESKGV